MTDTAKDQAIAQMKSVAQMVAALDVDYDRLEELREELAEAHDDSEANEVLDMRAELAELEAAAGDCTTQDEAQERIIEDALSVEVRSGCAAPSSMQPGEEWETAEYRIVLCTGGPHVEIQGDLNEHGEPSTARLMYQDWGTPLTQLFNRFFECPEEERDVVDEDVLIRYASQFLGC